MVGGGVKKQMFFLSRMMQKIASQNVPKSTSRPYLGMISTSFRIKKPRPDRQNHQNCMKTFKINQNRPKYFLKIVKSDPRLKNSTLCRFCNTHQLSAGCIYTRRLAADLRLPKTGQPQSGLFSNLLEKNCSNTEGGIFEARVGFYNSWEIFGSILIYF